MLLHFSDWARTSVSQNGVAIGLSCFAQIIDPCKKIQHRCRHNSDYIEITTILVRWKNSYFETLYPRFVFHPLKIEKKKTTVTL